MSLKSFVRELREMKDGLGSISRRGIGGKHWRGRTKTHIAPDETSPVSETVEQSLWANLPPELLLDIIRRVEESETSWPARAVVVYCASVCKSWREITKEIVKTPEQCGRLTFPISLKQPGPRDSLIQCFIRRDPATSMYLLHYGLVPSESENNKLLLAARKFRRATCADFIVSLSADDFSQASSTYVGKLRSNFLGTKFTMFDSQPTYDVSMRPTSRISCRFHSSQVSPRLPACTYNVGTIAYELNVLRTRGPRRMQCIMHRIPMSSIEEGGSAPTAAEMFKDPLSPLPGSKGKEPVSDINATSPLETPGLVLNALQEPLILRNKAPRWHEQLQCWCLNFRGRVTVASVKNFQLVAAVEPSHNVPAAEQERVILQFGKIGKDIFTMDYCYPLSAFQAFAICLSSFDTKPACE
uniref:Tubby-like F-box protein n=1 Tax=Rhizophora mucronata TaxID=61149 RepID=A0A2P2KLX7_RHIMU